MINSLSKLVLGTVQLGMEYGVNNKTGKPSREEAFSILDNAYENGINTLDTAFAYGDSEEVIGAWLEERKYKDVVSIISKMKPHSLNDYPDGTKSFEIVRGEVEKSLKRLGIEKLKGYLFHSPHYIYLSHMVDGMRKVKEEGLVENIGVSIYDEAEALQAAELAVDYIQVPYNLFDQRLDKTDFWNIAKQNKVTVFARSPFLQGLLLMESEAIPAHLSHATKLVKEFEQISEKTKISRTALALLFSCKHSHAEHVVFGVDTTDQLKEDMDIVENPPEGVETILEDLKTRFQDIPRSIVLPSLWGKVKGKK
jgi:uncharacterized protein